jgi:hypothetical protein
LPATAEVCIPQAKVEIVERQCDPLLYKDGET